MRLYFIFDSHVNLERGKHISAIVFSTQPFDKMISHFVDCFFFFPTNLTYPSYDKIVSNNYRPKRNNHILLYAGQPFAHDIIKQFREHFFNIFGFKEKLIFPVD